MDNIGFPGRFAREYSSSLGFLHILPGKLEPQLSMLVKAMFNCHLCKPMQGIPNLSKLDIAQVAE